MVSIHAPVRGATGQELRRARSGRSFNPRPRAGGDTALAMTFRQRPSFNPRPRAGGDITDWEDSGQWAVSIHAPVRGATQPQVLEQLVIWCFNPRPRAGGDDPKDIMILAKAMFQSTPPGGDQLSTLLGRPLVAVSIHAPVRGATPNVTSGTYRRPCFNPRPRAGGDVRPLSCNAAT